MIKSAFFQIEFILLIFFALIFPVSIFAYMLRKRAISRTSVLFFGVTLVAFGGVSVFLLQRLKTLSLTSLSLIDTRVFASEISFALYLLPVLFAGIGVNLISDVLIRHIAEAEKKCDNDHR
jgi:hypothetical protein